MSNAGYAAAGQGMNDFLKRVGNGNYTPTVEELQKEFREDGGLYDQFVGKRGQSSELTSDEYDRLIAYFDRVLPQITLANLEMGIGPDNMALQGAAADAVAVFTITQAIRTTVESPLKYGHNLRIHMENLSESLTSFLAEMARLDITSEGGGDVRASQEAAAEVFGKLDEMRDLLTPEQREEVDKLKAKAKTLGVPLS